ncbi:MAG: transketolase C-terminal domain-containing protein, partial [Acidimicrobiia bacterium]
MTIESGPVAIRWPKTTAPQSAAGEVGQGLSAREVRAGSGEVCFLAVGKMLAAAIEAADLLLADGIEASVWDVRVVKPLDRRMLAAAAGHRLVVTVEDGIVQGGIGSQIVDGMSGLEESRTIPPTLTLGIPSAFLPHGKPDRILADLGLDGPGVAAATLKALAPTRSIG